MRRTLFGPGLFSNGARNPHTQDAHGSGNATPVGVSLMEARLRGAGYFPTRTLSRLDLAFSSLGRRTVKMPFAQETSASSA